MKPRGVLCEIHVEAGTEWIDEDTETADQVYGPVLLNSPRFARRVDADALAKILANAENGLWRIGAGFADAFILCPLATDDVQWDPRRGELRVRLNASVWIFVSRRAFGDVAPIAFLDLCLLYYERVVGPLVSAYILQACGDPDAEGSDIRWRACEGLRDAFSEGAPRLPSFEPFQEELQQCLADGLSSDEAFVRVGRRLLREGERALRAVVVDAP